MWGAGSRSSHEPRPAFGDAAAEVFGPGAKLLETGAQAEVFAPVSGKTQAERQPLLEHGAGDLEMTLKAVGRGTGSEGLVRTGLAREQGHRPGRWGEAVVVPLEGRKLVRQIVQDGIRLAPGELPQKAEAELRTASQGDRTAERPGEELGAETDAEQGSAVPHKPPHEPEQMGKMGAAPVVERVHHPSEHDEGIESPGIVEPRRSSGGMAQGEGDAPGCEDFGDEARGRIIAVLEDQNLHGRRISRG